MSAGRLAPAHRLLTEAVDELRAAAGPGATADELISVLTLCEGVARRLDQLEVGTISALQRRGTFTERGYKSAGGALSDLLGWERYEARLRVVAAEQVCTRISLDGTPLPARLPATAVAFTTGRIGLRHVDVLAKVLGSATADRLSPPVWTAAEAELAEKAGIYTPNELLTYGTALVESLDADGPEPDHRPPPQINELTLTPRRGAPGGTLKGRFDDAAMFDAIATVIDAKAKPVTGDDERTTPQRQAEALADVCSYVLDHGDVPGCGGRRPQLNVIIRLEDLETRARSAMLDFGRTLSSGSLRMLACDAAVVPIVMNGRSQPLGVGRSTRVIPDGLRRAVAARDGGCARCGRPPSWSEIHHLLPWEDGGETKLDNCAMVCRVCHRLLHHSEWTVRMRDGRPEFIPPGWIDAQRRPRQRPPRLLDAA